MRSLPFQGPPLPMALEMDVARIKIISSRPILTTGTLIVIIMLSLDLQGQYQDILLYDVFGHSGPVSRY